MKVLMITGDKDLLTPGTSAYARLALQQSVVEIVRPVYWGRGNVLAVFRIQGAFDVVTAQDPFFRGLIAWYMARRLGARLNMQVHADLDGQSWWKHVLAGIMLRRADSVRVVSEKIKEQVVRMGIQANIMILPVFVDVKGFTAVVPRPHESKNIVWIGRFEKEKNPLQAVDVLKEVLTTVPNAQLIMLGKGSLEEEIKKRAAGLPVQIPGWQSHPAVYFNTADVALCTSWYESWGASIVEALAAGVPVVAPDVGIAKEAGAFIEQRSNLAKAVVQVLTQGVRGKLKISLLSEQEWAEAWKQSL